MYPNEVSSAVYAPAMRGGNFASNPHCVGKARLHPGGAGVLPILPDFSAAHRWNVQRIRREPQRLQELAERLWVSTEALRLIGCGWSGSAWTFPMWQQGRVVGLKRCWPGGRKDCHRASNLGVLLPQGEVPRAETLLIVEGIGLPGVLNCRDLLAEVVPGRRVAIVSDADESGKVAAEGLVRKLAPVCRSIRRIVPETKDMRAWLQAGLTAEALRERIKAVGPVRAVATEVRWSHRHGRSCV